MAVATRTERDSFGDIEVPAEALWGAQTARSLQFFAIGQPLMPPPLVHALGELKQAAAQVNAQLGLLPARKAKAIAAAAARVAAGELDAQFPLSVWQTGSGTQTHMNVNEVIANLASQAMGGGLGANRTVHAHDEVNLGQSSNDVFPSAMHVAAVLQARALVVSLQALRAALRAKAHAFAQVLKIGRTHLQDATPITLGQEFDAFDAQLALAQAALVQALPAVHALAIGGTAVGNGVNTHPEFGTRVAANLALRLHEPFTCAPNRLAALAGHEALVGLHGALRLLAVALLKIASDIRLMGSGPRAGLGELNLPANEPGSSIMPGKVNPTQVEALTMVCIQVLGHDVAVVFAASMGQFELNTCKPLIAFDVLDSLQLLTTAMASFTTHAVSGLEANVAHMQAVLSNTLAGATALSPHIGHERAAALALQAHAQRVALRDLALKEPDISPAQYDRWVNPRRMAGLE